MLSILHTTENPIHSLLFQHRDETTTPHKFLNKKEREKTEQNIDHEVMICVIYKVEHL